MARLPQTGSDEGTWGTILNDFLAVTHNADGTIKTALIAETQLDTSVQAKLNGAGVSGVASVNTRSGVVTLTKTDVGLGNVDNTADTAKAFAASQVTSGTLAIGRIPTGSTSSTVSLGNHTHAESDVTNLTTDLAAKVPTTRTVNGHTLSADVTVTKSDVSLGNVDNTSDANKPVSTATQTALNLKLNSADPPMLTTAGRLEQARATADTSARWITRYTASDFSTTTQNVAEHYVSMKGSVIGAPNMASWHNEWGALRGTSPYSWGDALFRGVRTTGDGVTGGQFIELSDRTVTPQVIRWGRKWTDGSLVRNGVNLRETVTWKTGDADPTTGGTVALPSLVSWIFVLATADTLPSWAPVGSIVIRS